MNKEVAIISKDAVLHALDIVWEYSFPSNASVTFSLFSPKTGPMSMLDYNIVTTVTGISDKDLTDDIICPVSKI